jgi:hypothetical protein
MSKPVTVSVTIAPETLALIDRLISHAHGGNDGPRSRAALVQQAVLEYLSLPVT